MAERKKRDNLARAARITDAARAIAAKEGWNAVTVRRLAGEIACSQPVLYAHFRNRDAIVTAVAMQGFDMLCATLLATAAAASTPQDALHSVATAYLDFAFDEAALYEAMFVLPTDLHFARDDVPAPLQQAFSALAAVVAPFCTDVELATETLWAALHGAAQLERHGRIRPAFRAERLALLLQTLLNS